MPTFAWAAAADPLIAATKAVIATGVAMRRYGSTLELLPPPQAALSTSKSATSHRFVTLSELPHAEADNRRRAAAVAPSQSGLVPSIEGVAC